MEAVQTILDKIQIGWRTHETNPFVTKCCQVIDGFCKGVLTVNIVPCIAFMIFRTTMHDERKTRFLQKLDPRIDL